MSILVANNSVLFLFCYRRLPTVTYGQVRYAISHHGRGSDTDGCDSVIEYWNAVENAFVVVSKNLPH